MEPKIPDWLRLVIRKLNFFAVPNLGTLLAALAVVGFVTNIVTPIPLDRLVFDPDLVLQGEWWRLFTFPFLGPSSSQPIFFIFYVLYIYFILNTIEEGWGAANLTVYLGLGYIGLLAGAFLTRLPVDINKFLLENVSLAFGTLYPNFTLNLYFVIPVRAKWLAMLAGALILYDFVQVGLWGKVFLLLAFAPYLLFFGAHLYRVCRGKWKTRQNRKRFDDDMWRR